MYFEEEKHPNNIVPTIADTFNWNPIFTLKFQNDDLKSQKMFSNDSLKQQKKDFADLLEQETDDYQKKFAQTKEQQATTIKMAAVAMAIAKRLQHFWLIVFCQKKLF